MTSKEIVFKALRDAEIALVTMFQLQEKVENIFGEESPMYKELQEAIDSLDLVGELDYELYGGNFGPGTEEERLDVFLKWLEEETE